MPPSGVTYREVQTVEELRAIIGEPIPAVANKERASLHAYQRAFIEASPFCLVATADADGTCDVSPKGDPVGFTHIVDDRTIVIPERPGNRRADGFLNVLANPHVGLIYLIPGRGDTLRIAGRARVITDADVFDQLEVNGHRPRLALLVDIEQVFFHCAKALYRSQLWEPQSWRPDALPRRAVIAHETERQDQTLEEVDAYYGPSYRENMYRETPSPTDTD